MTHLIENVQHYPIRSIFQRTSGTDGSPVFTDLRILVPASGVDGSQESYLVKEIVPMADVMFPQAARVRLLLGFSKAGWGAISLILRHPELFHAAAAWDAPLMMRQISPAKYADEDVVFGGDNACFDTHYRLDARLEAIERVAGALLGRLADGGDLNPGHDVSAAHRQEHAGDVSG